jgi:Protein of unknown function (DUF2490)
LKKIIIIPSLLLSAKAFTQRPHTGMWLNANVPVSITKKWQWYNDVSYRTLGSSIAPLQYEYRTGIRYNFNSQWSATAGAAFFFSRNGFSKQQDEFGKEFRLWQELAYRKNFTKTFQLYVRLRAEERNFAATSTKAAYHAFRYRIRTQLQQQLNKHWAIQLVDEYFQQHRSTWSFDQNRAMANAVYFINKQTNITAGYMWLRWPAGSYQHILNITLQKNISLHGK